MLGLLNQHLMQGGHGLVSLTNDDRVVRPIDRQLFQKLFSLADQIRVGLDTVSGDFYLGGQLNLKFCYFPAMMLGINKVSQGGVTFTATFLLTMTAINAFATLRAVQVRVMAAVASSIYRRLLLCGRQVAQAL
jgi:hypothetical protein